MMRINIAICDDEQKSLQMIQKELYHIADKLKIEIETYAYKEGKKVLDLIYNEKEDFDVLLSKAEEMIKKHFAGIQNPKTQQSRDRCG